MLRTLNNILETFSVLVEIRFFHVRLLLKVIQRKLKISVSDILIPLILISTERILDHNNRALKNMWTSH